MSLKETYDDLFFKSSEVQKNLETLKQRMEELDTQIQVIERNPNFLETYVEPLYELLWKARIDYKKQQTEFHTLTLQLQQLNHILEDLH